ncbi:MAG: type II secretion system F family protein [Candidatus Aenigmatarchaeota archaeon]
MDFYTKLAFKFFGQYTETFSLFFTDLKTDLRKARMMISTEEYISIAILTTLIVFLFEVPIFSYIFGFIFKAFLFSFITAFTVSLVFSLLIFVFFIKYPKIVIGERSKNIDNVLPFASLYLSTVASSKLPLDKTFKIFSKFSRYGPVTEEINSITKDIEVFGLDIHTAIGKSIDRNPSKNLKDVLWGILSTSVSGGDIAVYLREKSKSLMQEYTRRLNEYSKKLTLFIEIYLTLVILGAIFFIILSSIFSSLGGSTSGILMLQSLIIFIFIPLLSLFFIIMVKMSSPGGE